jgi:predicted dehydrogenase
MTEILIVGLGQLGTRYLQGLLSGSVSFCIDIVEPSDESFNTAIALIGSDADISTSSISRVSLDKLKPKYSLCIVATSAAQRAQIIENLAAHTNAENWVIEKVLAQSEQQLELICKSVKSSDGAWVNTPRRRTSIYRKLKLLLDAGVPITFNANFPAMGLGCNSIHFIDLVSWLVDSEVNSVVIKSTEGWKPSKREGFSEFDGQMMVSYLDGSVLHINSDPQALASLALKQGDREFSLDESKGILEGGQIFPGRVEYQSELSLSLVEDILNQRMRDGLPTLQQSVKQHLKLFEAIRSCEALQNNLDLGIPIT